MQHTGRFKTVKLYTLRFTYGGEMLYASTPEGSHFRTDALQAPSTRSHVDRLPRVGWKPCKRVHKLARFVGHFSIDLKE